MKDMYSFHATREDLESFYDRAVVAYRRVYDRCGVQSLRVRASGGIFTERISDEFHVETPSGEDTLLRCAKCREGVNTEVADAPHTCSVCGTPYEQVKGIEVGNTFDLDTKYSTAFGFTFTDADGAARPVIMGCYGIGTTRLVGAIAEANHDDRGVIWPASVAPFDVHVVAIPSKDAEASQETFAQAEGVVAQLEGARYDVLYDDRTSVSAGQKFADADLIGIPWRVVVSARSMAAGGVEVKARAGGGPRTVPTADLLSALGR
jgi:prolyl-tRNA synthetase